MDHLDNHMRKECSKLFGVNSIPFQLYCLIEMYAMDILHHEHSPGRLQQYLRNVDIFEVVFFQKILSPLHIRGLVVKV